MSDTVSDTGHGRSGYPAPRGEGPARRARDGTRPRRRRCARLGSRPSRTSRSRRTTASRSPRRCTCPTARRTAGGWPAIVFLHGLSGNRQQMNALVEAIRRSRAVRSPHLRRARPRAIRRARRHRRAARGRGHAGGVRLACRAARRVRHEDRRLGHLLRRRSGLELARGRRAVGGRRGTVETWTDLYSALVPQGSSSRAPSPASSGSIPPGGVDPTLDTRAGGGLHGQRLPVVKACGRALEPPEARAASRRRVHGAGPPRLRLRDRPGERATTRLAGPKELWIGLHGHAPSIVSRADTPRCSAARGRRGSTDISARADEPPKRAVEIVPENYAGNADVGVAKRGTLPPVSPTFVSFPEGHDLRPERKGGAHVRQAARVRSRSSGPRRCRRRSPRAGAGRGSWPCSPRRHPQGRRSS